MTAAAEATLWTSVLILVVGGTFLALWYGEGVRFAVFALWVAALLGLWMARFAVPAWRGRRNAETALLLERHCPELRNDLTSSLEFGDALAGADAERLGSPDLMQAMVDRTAKSLEGRIGSLERLLPGHGMPRVRKVGLAALVVFALSLVVWPTGPRLGVSRLLFGLEESPLTVAEIDKIDREPLVAGIRVSYRYPAYTGRQPLRLDNATGHIEVLAGTEVTLEATALRDLEAVAMVIHAGSEDEGVSTEIDMAMELRRLSVVFTPLQDSTYFFRGIEPGGEELVDPIERIVRVVPDSVPEVELMTPDSLVQAAADDVIPFRFTASDDYGLTELAFVHAFAGDDSHERRQTLLTIDGELVVQDAAGFDLAPLGLQPRDEIVAYVEAVDNDTIGGPKGGRSRPIRIRIASAEDRHLETIEREEELFEALLDVLGDYLENPIANITFSRGEVEISYDDLGPDEANRRYRSAHAISDKVLSVISLMRDLLALMEEDELALRRDYEIIQSTYDVLYELHRQEQNVLTSMSRPASRGTLGQHHLTRIDQVRGEQVRETEQAILTLEEIIGSQRMESLVRTLEELGEVQDRLRDLLEQYRDTSDPELRSEIQRELSRLEARMQELLQRHDNLHMSVKVAVDSPVETRVAAAISFMVAGMAP